MSKLKKEVKTSFNIIHEEVENDMVSMRIKYALSHRRNPRKIPTDGGHYRIYLEPLDVEINIYSQNIIIA